MRAGERNTHYFHTCVLNCRRKAHILQLREKNGDWIMDPEVLKQQALPFYQQLYSKDGASVCYPTQWNFPRLNQNSKWWLNREITEYEAKLVVNQLGTHKAPELDGLLVIFYQKY